jgi:hypothetical protein
VGVAVVGETVGFKVGDWVGVLVVGEKVGVRDGDAVGVFVVGDVVGDDVIGRVNCLGYE